MVDTTLGIVRASAMLGAWFVLVGSYMQMRLAARAFSTLLDERAAHGELRREVVGHMPVWQRARRKAARAEVDTVLENAEREALSTVTRHEIAWLMICAGAFWVALLGSFDLAAWLLSRE